MNCFAVFAGEATGEFTATVSVSAVVCSTQ